MAGVPFVAKLALWIVAFSSGSFFALTTLLKVLVDVIRKGPRAVFCVKQRSSPPACMQDPTLGVHGFAHLQDVRLHYVSNGAEDKPLMLLVHGFPEFWYSWRYQLREFKDTFRVVAIDQRGYGDSDKPDSVSSYALQTLVNDIKQLVPALGYKQCVLVGHDWGGIVTWAVAQTCPEIVERLIVMNSTCSHAYFQHVRSSRSQLLKSWYSCLFQIPFVPELLMRMSDMESLDGLSHGPMGVLSGIMTKEDVEAYKYNFQRNGFTHPINYYRALFRYPDFFMSHLNRAELKVTCPTLILWGCKDTALEKGLAALSAQATMSGEAAVKYIEDSSHWTPMDQPEIVNQHMREFLDSTSQKSRL